MSGRSHGIWVPFQLNHFPGSFQIGRKDRLWRNLLKMQTRCGKKEFNFFPQSFILPQDIKLLRKAWEEGASQQKWIVKPVRAKLHAIPCPCVAAGRTSHPFSLMFCSQHQQEALAFRLSTNGASSPKRDRCWCRGEGRKTRLTGRLPSASPLRPDLGRSGHYPAEQKHLICVWKLLCCLGVMLLLEAWLCQLQPGLQECCYPCRKFCGLGYNLDLSLAPQAFWSFCLAGEPASALLGSHSHCFELWGLVSLEAHEPYPVLISPLGGVGNWPKGCLEMRGFSKSLLVQKNGVAHLGLCLLSGKVLLRAGALCCLAGGELLCWLVCLPCEAISSFYRKS